jgi:hypothetical protein
MDLIQEIDLFGEQFNFTILGKTKYKTFFGGVLTLIMFIATVVFCVLFGMDLIIRSNPKVMTERIIPNNYPYVNCTIDNFPIFRRIADDITTNITNILFPQLALQLRIMNMIDLKF